MITPGEGDLQKGSSNPPPWDGSFDVLDALVINLLSQCVKKPKILWRTQMGAQKKRDDNGDDDIDHGEEWMENPHIYNKVSS